MLGIVLEVKKYANYETMTAVKREEVVPIKSKCHNGLLLTEIFTFPVTLSWLSSVMSRRFGKVRFC